jgi:hypothetical protein
VTGTISATSTISASGRIIPSEHIAPASTNASFLGLDLNRWKGVYSYIGDFATTLTVGGAATFSSTLGVTGYATFSNGMSVSGNFIAGGTLATNSDCYVSGNLYGVGGLIICPQASYVGITLTGTTLSGNVYPTTTNVVLLGTTGARWAQIHSATGVDTSSDSRVKLNIAPITDAGFGLSFIRKLRPVSYQRNDVLVKDSNGDYQIGVSPDLHTGFVAQEVLVKQERVQEALNLRNRRRHGTPGLHELDSAGLRCAVFGSVERAGYHAAVKVQFDFAFLFAVPNDVIGELAAADPADAVQDCRLALLDFAVEKNQRLVNGDDLFGNLADVSDY